MPVYIHHTENTCICNDATIISELVFEAVSTVWVAVAARSA